MSTGSALLIQTADTPIRKLADGTNSELKLLREQVDQYIQKIQLFRDRAMSAAAAPHECFNRAPQMVQEVCDRVT